MYCFLFCFVFCLAVIYSIITQPTLRRPFCVSATGDRLRERMRGVPDHRDLRGPAEESGRKPVVAETSVQTRIRASNGNLGGDGTPTQGVEGEGRARADSLEEVTVTLGSEGEED